MAGVALLSLSAQAQITWINPAGGDWNDGANWDYGAAPAAGDTANLTAELGSPYAVSYSTPMAAPSVYSVTMSAASSAVTNRLLISAAGFNVEDRITIWTNSTVVVNPGGAITVGTFEGLKGTLIMNGGSITCLTAYAHGTAGKPVVVPSNARIYGGVFVTPATTLGGSENGGTLIIDGGEVDLGVYSSSRDSGANNNAFTTGLIVSNGVVRLSGITLSTGNSASSMRVSGGQVINTGPFLIGNSGTATTRETGYRQTGGVFDTTAAGENIVVGNSANASRVSLDVRGGSMSAYGVTLVSDPAFTSVNATFSVADTGVVYLGAGGILNYATTYAVNLGNGGLLGASAPWGLGGDLTLSGGVGFLAAENAAHTPFDIVIAGGLKGAGVFAKTGLGKVTIQGPSTHTGEAHVREGTLALEGGGTLSSAVISVFDGTRFECGTAFTLSGGQSLAGVGTVAGVVTAAEGSGVRPAGNGATGQLTVEGDLTLSGDVTATFDIQSAAAKDLLVVSGTLTLSGANTIFVISTLGSGTYRLIDYGSLVGDVASLEVVGANGYVVNNTTAGAIDLVIESTGRDPASLVWKGDGLYNFWDNGVSKNWLNQAQADWFFPNDSVMFDFAGSVAPPVELVGDLAPATILVDSTTDYTFTGAGRVVGTTGLTKTGSGALTITTVNDFTGVTRLAGGTVRVPNLANGGVPSPLGSAGVAPSNLVFDGGTLDYTGPSASSDRGATLDAGGGVLVVTDPDATLTVDGQITGAGALTKSGPGILQLANAANEYAGGTVVTGGTLLFGNTSSGPITLDGGTFATTADQQNLGNALVIVGTGNRYLNAKNNTIAAVSGDGALELEFAAAGDTITMGGDMSGFTGHIAARGTGGNWRFHGFGNPGSAAASFDLGTNSAVMLTRNGNVTVRLGSLTGDATTKLSGATSATGALTTYEIGGNNASTTFDGAIVDSARPAPVAITKVGTGTLTLTASSAYTGATRVLEGTLALKDYPDITTSSRFEVLEGATLDMTGCVDPTLYLVSGDTVARTLAGDGMIKGNAVSSWDASVIPGNPVGALTVTGTIALDGTTLMELNRDLAPNCDSISADQVMAGGALVVTNAGAMLRADDRFQLFSKAISGEFASLELPLTDASGAAYTWENNLTADGSIRVLTVTGGTPTTPTDLTLAVTAPGSLTLSWPIEYIGWSIEAQTNSISTGLSTNWHKVPGAETVNVLNIPVDPANGTVFFRMVLP